MMRGMVIDMNDEQLHNVAQLQAFWDGTIEVDFAVPADERYEFTRGSSLTALPYGFTRSK